MNESAGLPSAKRLLADDVFTQIGMAIVEGRLAPGERIRDSEIAAHYQVSRTPVREALQRLERLGMVEMSPSRYTRVTEPSEEMTEDTRIFLGYQNGVICALTVGGLSDEERADAVALADAALAVADDAAAFWDARLKLFAYLHSRVSNLFFRELGSDTVMAVLRYLRLWVPTAEQHATGLTALSALRDAIHAADAPAAERAARGVYGLPWEEAAPHAIA